MTADTRIDIVDVRSGTRITYVSVPSGQVIHQPSWMPNGTDIAYHLFHDGKNDLMAGTKPLVQDEEVFPFRASFTKDWRYFYTSGGVIRTRRAGSNAVGTVGFTAALRAVTPKYQKGQRDFDGKGSFPVVGIGSPVLSPDGTSIAFRALNDIYTMASAASPHRSSTTGGGSATRTGHRTGADSRSSRTGPALSTSGFATWPQGVTPNSHI